MAHTLKSTSGAAHASPPTRRARVAAHATAEASAGLLLRIVGNVLTNPDEPKYRKVKLSNAKVAGKFYFVFVRAIR